MSRGSPFHRVKVDVPLLDRMRIGQLISLCKSLKSEHGNEKNKLRVRYDENLLLSTDETACGTVDISSNRKATTAIVKQAVHDAVMKHKRTQNRLLLKKS